MKLVRILLLLLVGYILYNTFIVHEGFDQSVTDIIIIVIVGLFLIVLIGATIFN